MDQAGLRLHHIEHSAIGACSIRREAVSGLPLRRSARHFSDSAIFPFYSHHRGMQPRNRPPVVAFCSCGYHCSISIWHARMEGSFEAMATVDVYLTARSITSLARRIQLSKSVPFRFLRAIILSSG